MLLEGLHEKQLFAENYPFRLADNSQNGFYFPFHWHSAVELVYSITGECTVNVNGRDIVVAEKDILLIAGGDIHNLQTPEQTGRRIFIQFDLSLLQGFGGFDTIRPFLSQTRKFIRTADAQLHALLEEKLLGILCEYETREFAYALLLNARILEITAILARGLSRNTPSDYPERTNRRVTGLDKLNQALKFIEENYQNDITLKDAASSAGFSEYHFSRLFKDITEKSFSTYLNECRVRKAEKLLKTENTTIAQIAHISGFNSLATFNRVFRDIKGCSPSMYRKTKVFQSPLPKGRP